MRLILVLSFFLVGTVHASNHFAAGDTEFLHRRSRDSALKALELYREAYATNPKDPEAGWRLAMACQFVGFRLTTSSRDKEKLFREGRDAGLQSLTLAPNCAACQFWTAIDEALYGDAVGPLKMLFTLGEIREHLERTIALDPHYALGGPYRILALIDEKLPGILGGDDDRALKYLQTAVKMAPGEPLNYLFLAKLLDETFHRRPEALAAAREGLRQPLVKDAPIESLESVSELKTLVAGWESSTTH